MAVARHYLDGAPEPRELRLARQAKKWGRLPRDGGLWDQPAGLVHRMEWSLDVHAILRARYEANNGVAWARANPEAHEFYAYVKLLYKRATENNG